MVYLHRGRVATAWYLCHRIRSAMDEAIIEQLDGTVEIDETYIGGKSTGRGRDKGKTFEDKVMVLGAIERRAFTTRPTSGSGVTCPRSPSRARGAS